MGQSRGLGLLRAAALIASPLGAVGSLALMFHVGRHQRSIILMILFTVWVLSPFVALFLGGLVSTGWAASSRATLYGLTLVVTLSSLAIYASIALGPPRPRPAAAFLLVPGASWLLGAFAVSLAGLGPSRHSDRKP